MRKLSYFDLFRANNSKIKNTIEKKGSNKHLLVQNDNRNTRKSCEICPKLTIKTP